jgi:hypothetical protein
VGDSTSTVIRIYDTVSGNPPTNLLNPQFVTDLTLGIGLKGFALDDGAKTLYAILSPVTMQDQLVKVVNTETNQIIKTFPADSPTSVAINPLSHRAYVTNRKSTSGQIPGQPLNSTPGFVGSLMSFNTLTNELINFQTEFKEPVGVFLSTVTSKLYVVNSGLPISDIDAQTPDKFRGSSAITVLDVSSDTNTVLGKLPFSETFDGTQIKAVDVTNAAKIKDQTILTNRIYFLPVADHLSPSVGIRYIEDTAKFITPLEPLKVEFIAKDNFDTTPKVEAILRPLGAISSLSDISVTNNQQSNVLNITTGYWTLLIRAQDIFENTKLQASGIFQVIHDIQPPRTELNLAGPLFSLNGSTYITSQTGLTLSATDDLLVPGDSIGLGVAETDLAIDLSPFSLYSGRFNLLEGIHTLKYFSKDVVNNIESIHVATLLVDNTPPLTQVNTSGPASQDSRNLFVSTVTLISIIGNDPVVNGVPSGVKNTEFKIDTGSFSQYTAPFTLSEGSRTVSFDSTDNVDNHESTKTATILADGTPPQTQVSVLGVKFIRDTSTFLSAGASSYISAGSRIQLTAQDPVVNGVASGVRETLSSIRIFDSSGNFVMDNPFQLYFSSPLALTEGIKRLSFFSRDNVLNTETVQSKGYLVDDTSPTVTISFVNGRQFINSSGTIYVSGDTGYKFEVQDSTSNGVMSGAKRLEVSVDSAPFNITVGTFGTIGPCFVCSSAPFSEGNHLFRYHGADNVENVSVDSAVFINVDRTAPQTQLIISGAQFSSGGKLYINLATQLSFNAQDPVVNNVASGVNRTLFSIDGAAFQTISSSSSFTLPEGIHTVQFYSVDNVENREQTQSVTLNVDGTPPITTISISSPTFTAFGTTYISANSPISLSAIDPIVKSVASGLNSINFRVDGQPFKGYSSPFTIASLLTITTGTHTIDYFSIDNVTNQEQTKTQRVFVTVLLDYALIGTNSLQLHGNSQTAGDVRSNGSAQLNGHPTLTGSVFASTVTLAGHPTVTGSVMQNVSLISSVPIDLVSISSAVILNNNNSLIPKTQKGQTALTADNMLVMNGQDSLALPQGTYFFKGISLAGGSVVTITGNVNIFCSGDLNITANSNMNLAGNPFNLALFMDTGAMSVNGGSELDGTAYVPFSSIQINGNSKGVGSFFGSDGDVGGSSGLDTTFLTKPNSNVPVSTAPSSGGKAALGFNSNTIGPSPDFILGEVYFFPNPAVSKNPTIHMECGIADSVEMRIYDVAGDLVHETRIEQAPQVINNKYAYEYAWDSSGIASGVYIYVVVAKKSGETDIRVMKKLAVVR